jgi:membrane protease YdiL (CAAX protease family)
MSANDRDNPWADPPDPYQSGESADEPETQEPKLPYEVVEDVLPVECWRCGLNDAPVRGKCRKCKAKIGPDTDDWSEPSQKTASGEEVTASQSVVRAIVLYGVFLLVSVIFGGILFKAAHRLSDEELLGLTAVMEVIDTIIALVGLVWIGRQQLPDLSPGSRLTAWVVAVPVLLLLLCVNIVYANFLRDMLRPGAQPIAPPITALTIALICIQPALVEELFFRYVAFGAIYRATGLHTTVWITAVMFAGAHIYNPLGMPYLLLAGVVFGYARVWGGLALPMVLHFLHNLAVLVFEGI